MSIKHIFIKTTTFFSIFLILLGYCYTFADDIDISENINISTQLENDEIIETSSNDISSLKLNSRSCVVLDRLSQKILYGKNENNKVKMASTTKIMTATVIIENCDLSKTIEVSKKAAGTGGSRLGLKTGDKITIKDLLYGLLLCSGNDAAVALAEAASGSIQNFSKLMNNKANSLGLTNTHFESPHGLDSDGHYTTAYELAVLTNYALKNQIFCQIVGTKNYTVTINGYPKNLNNTNELLGYLDGVYGVKTGFTNGANRCLVSACKRGNMDIICVVLGCDTKKFRTTDSIKLIEYAFNNFEYVDVNKLITEKFTTWKSENENYFKIDKGTSCNLEIKYSELENAIVPINKNEISSIEVNIHMKQLFEAPVYENDIVGTIEVSSANKFIEHCDILASNTIKRKNVFQYMYGFFKDYSRILNI